MEQLDLSEEVTRPVLAFYRGYPIQLVSVAYGCGNGKALAELFLVTSASLIACICEDEESIQKYQFEGQDVNCRSIETIFNP